MKKSFLNLGRELTKKEQKNVHGGYGGGASGGGNGDGSGGGSSTGNKDIGEGCTIGSSLPHLSCKPGLECISNNHIGIGLCAVVVGNGAGYYM